MHGRVLAPDGSPVPNAELQVFPATPHPFEKVSMPMIAGAVREFFA